ncbi:MULTISPECIES: lipocalin family protein [Pseudoalteromonas]|uniref:Outer membrane lipoprotein Blc n=2 Tax=Pseudoalteromonas TaxID=53246 RepID=A0A5S3V140_9GAMM|nr:MULTISPECIES: lipocalin family protein [Pseudoalteromonas]MCG7562372.1 lipocalin family protein [Pseudoalteromonas sp. McH1-42]MEC4087265.1 lipocalin family protein [Pseudoalteromonas rubra]QPB83763.1 lipocalin [Pseudoalteromonas rubra]
MKTVLIIMMTLVLSSCLGMPQGVQPVGNFELNRYLGKWYEIARLDHSFERGLTRVTAQYSMREDGGVKVINRGFNAAENQWREAEGKAFFVNQDDEAYLKVSFFGPFYGAYVVFELDHDNYQYAFVSGPDTEYLWLLSRTPQVDQAIIDKFVSMAADRGFDTDALIFVEQ